MYSLQRIQTLIKPTKNWGPALDVSEMKRALMGLPDYMVSEKEEGVDNPGALHWQPSMTSDPDGSCSTADVSCYEFFYFPSITCDGGSIHL